MGFALLIYTATYARRYRASAGATRCLFIRRRLQKDCKSLVNIVNRSFTLPNAITATATNFYVPFLAQKIVFLPVIRALVLRNDELWVEALKIESQEHLMVKPFRIHRKNSNLQWTSGFGKDIRQ